MTKKNLKPQQAAPVQREINTTSSANGKGIFPQHLGMEHPNYGFWMPFAGDDAE